MFKSILKVEAQSRLNYFKALSTGKLIVYLFLAMIILAMIVPAVWMVINLFLMNAEEIVIGKALVLLSMFLVLILSLFLVNGIIKEMFMDKNIDSYLVLPVTPKAVFSVKLFYQITFKVLPVILFISIAAGLTLAVRYEAPMLVLSSAVYFLFIGAVSAAAAYAIVFAVTKISSARRVGEILTLAGGMASVLPYFVIVAGGQYIMPVIEMMPKADFIFAGFLYDPSAVKYIIMLAVFSVAAVLLIMFVLNYVTAAFVKGTANTRTSERKKAVSVNTGSPVRALLKKDITMTLRDFKEWAAVLPQYLFPFVFLYLLTSNPMMYGGESSSDDQVMMTIAFAGSIMISLFVGAMNTARDARTYAFLKMMPVSGLDIAKAKYLYNFITITPVYVFITVIIYFILDVPFTTLLYAVLASVLLVLITAPVGMLLGTINPVVSKKNPAQRLDTAANIIIAVMIMVLIFLMGYLTQFTIGFNGESYFLKHDTMLMVLGVLIVLSILSYVILLRKAGARYDEGYNITYKN
ncbi:hypothetical protein BN1048_01149 [Jeotgalicoccus saudimassiliensis]|uniref:ABC-2 type transporter transmembrane domain-containing protein n=1 Tax=Jeotgalicoccus saudimassiliensis TaxID=1461582 RepID=A0A078M3U0_9STAP|nr:ABC-2 transporter permease [Jeotgalicoccus saudimassiliensis]CEA00914.1 hypothetical protein BN1048_01149 [Jeotgalicoccus saudimassiliensis]